jgi:hypothetical protein
VALQSAYRDRVVGEFTDAPFLPKRLRHRRDTGVTVQLNGTHAIGGTRQSRASGRA